jgi:hypothetical protein
MGPTAKKPAGIATGIIAMHRAAGIEAESFAAPDDPHREQQEPIAVDGLKGTARLRPSGHARLRSWLGSDSLLFVHGGVPDGSPIVVLTLDAYRQLSHIRTD